MKRRTSRILSLIILGLLMLGTWAATASKPAFAACTPPCIEAITPGNFNPTQVTTLTIQGQNLDTLVNPRVRFDGSASLIRSAQQPPDGTLIVTLPANFLPSHGASGYTWIVEVIADPGSTVINGKLQLVEDPGPTNTPAPTAFARPLVVVYSYGPSSSPIQPGQTFDLEVNIVNNGQLTATNVVVTFFPGDLEPRTTGGLRVIGNLDPGGTAKIIQTFTAKTDLSTGLAILDAEIRYNDVAGTAYTDKARLTLDIKKPTSGGGGASPTHTPTPTPGAVNRPQFVIASYTTDVQTLKPGVVFTLNLDVVNRGTAPAKAVSMIVGGGSASDSGTPGAGGGGVSGGSGEFTNFAPINSSNVQVLGDVPTGSTVQASQSLIVNSTTKPGAYSLKISFVYTDMNNARYTDDQVITLLVLQPPRVEVSFYHPPDPLFVGQPGSLPLQVVNLSTTSTVLGNMTVTAEGAEAMNNTLIVGNLEPGFPVTLDATLIPSQAGTLPLNITIEYTDDFNQQQIITETLEVEVMDAPIFEPGEGEGGIDGGGIEEPPVVEETFWQKVLRFIKGLFGLGSGQLPQNNNGGETIPGEFPTEEFPSEGGGRGGGVVVPVPGKGP